jgi:tetratricopeptide (TPR) repeat protein
LEIDNTLAEAHASLGMTRMSYEWDWPGAEREFQRAIELDSDYPTAHNWYAICLAATGQSDQAIASLKRAQELDPLSLIINADVGLVLHFARRDDEAIDQVRKGLEMDPNFAAGHRPLGMAYEQKAMYTEAIAEFQKALDVSRGNPFALGFPGTRPGRVGQTREGPPGAIRCAGAVKAPLRLSVRHRGHLLGLG